MGVDDHNVVEDKQSLNDTFIYLRLHHLDYTEKRLGTFESIYDCFRDKGLPKRLLIRGASGTGKSTVCLQLCTNWANERYTDLVSFTLLFHVKLQLVRMPTTLIEQDWMDMESFISKNQQKICVIMDDFDDLVHEARQCVLDIWSGKQYSNITVILTSQHKSFHTLTQHDNQALYYEIAPLDAHLKTKLITSCYVHNPELVDKAIKAIPDEPCLISLTNNPMYLFVFCMLLANMDGSIPTTHRGIMHDVVILYANTRYHHLGRIKRHHDGNPPEDVLHESDLPPEVQDIMTTLTVSALEKTKGKSLYVLNDPSNVSLYVLNDPSHVYNGVAYISHGEQNDHVSSISLPHGITSSISNSCDNASETYTKASSLSAFPQQACKKSCSKSAKKVVTSGSGAVPLSNDSFMASASRIAAKRASHETNTTYFSRYTICPNKMVTK